MFSRKRILFCGIFLFVVCAAVLYFAFTKPVLHGQSLIKNTVAQTSEPIPGNALTENPQQIIVLNASVRTAAAAVENMRLKDSLQWTFGGKPQRGWSIYVLLIRRTIETEHGPETPEFAEAVSAWQKKNGLAPSGKIDADTLYRMIENWQALRLNSSQYPLPEELLTAPITDFYDPTRDADLLKIERETYAAYKRMIREAAKDLNLKTTAGGELAPDEKFLKIISAFRSREYQQKLRAASPNSGRAGLAVNSPHFTGRALDIYVGGEPVSTNDFNRAVQVQTPAYQWLVKNAARFGFYPYYFEPWHWEYAPKIPKIESSQTKTSALP